MKARKSLRNRRQSGQGFWLFLALITFCIFGCILYIQYDEMKYYKDNNLWPSSADNFFFKRDESPVTRYPYKKAEPATDRPAAQTGTSTSATSTNAAPTTAEEPATNAPSATPEENE